MSLRAQIQQNWLSTRVFPPKKTIALLFLTCPCLIGQHQAVNSRNFTQSTSGNLCAFTWAAYHIFIPRPPWLKLLQLGCLPLIEMTGGAMLPHSDMKAPLYLRPIFQPYTKFMGACTRWVTDLIYSNHFHLTPVKHNCRFVVALMWSDVGHLE